MLTSLILGGPYPKWNSRNIPSESGFRFLDILHHFAFGFHLDQPMDFIDEFELPAISINGRAGAPDYAVLWDHQLWIIELKTELSSHRKDQLPLYLELAEHHYSSYHIQILYITPSMARLNKDGMKDHLFYHLFWSELSPYIKKIWSESEHQAERTLESALQRELSHLNQPTKSFRNNAETIRNALKLAPLVQKTGEQMAVEINVGGLDEIIELRIRIRDALNRLAGANNVKPWIWFEKSSGGKPLTELGRQVGCEIRLSRYK